MLTPLILILLGSQKAESAMSPDGKIEIPGPVKPKLGSVPELPLTSLNAILGSAKEGRGQLPASSPSSSTQPLSSHGIATQAPPVESTSDAKLLSTPQGADLDRGLAQAKSPGVASEPPLLAGDSPGQARYRLDYEFWASTEKKRMELWYEDMLSWQKQVKTSFAQWGADQKVFMDTFHAACAEWKTSVDANVHSISTQLEATEQQLSKAKAIADSGKESWTKANADRNAANEAKRHQYQKELRLWETANTQRQESIAEQVAVFGEASKSFQDSLSSLKRLSDSGSQASPSTSASQTVEEVSLNSKTTSLSVNPATSNAAPPVDKKTQATIAPSNPALASNPSPKKHLANAFFTVPAAQRTVPWMF